MKLLPELLVVCLFGALHAATLPKEMGVSEDESPLGKRYVESIIGSDIGKIKDFIMQKNFVEFLLNQREKKSKLVEEEERLYKELLKLSQEKQKRNI